MARPREFNEEQALDQATDVFWEQGYEGTSLGDLLKAMGIQKGSFYNTFGSKRELYLRCLERYRDVQMMNLGPFGDVVRAIAKGPEALYGVFSEQLDSLAAGDSLAGCFVASAALENREHVPDVLDVTRPSVERAREILTKAISDAQRAGTMPAAADPAVAATMMMSMGYGSQVLAAAGVSKEALMSGIGGLFAMMGGTAAMGGAAVSAGSPTVNAGGSPAEA